MIRLLISVALALAVATSAEAMSPAPLHEPELHDHESPQSSPTRVLGSQSGTSQWYLRWIMPAMSPEPNTCVFHGMKAFALSTMGR